MNYHYTKNVVVSGTECSFSIKILKSYFSIFNIKFLIYKIKIF